MKTSAARSIQLSTFDAALRPSATRGAWGALGLDAALLLGSWSYLLNITQGGGATTIPLLTALAASLAYLGDHLLDARRLDSRAELSARHRFTQRFRRPLEFLWIVIAVAGVSYASRVLPLATLRTALGLAAATVIYLLACRRWPRVLRAWPPRELAVGGFFALGLAVLGEGSLRIGDLIGFGFVCALDALAVALRERSVDLAQNELSSATRWPWLERAFFPIAIAVALLGGAGAWFHIVSLPVGVAVVIAASGLALIESMSRRSFPVDLTVTLAAGFGIAAHHVF